MTSERYRNFSTDSMGRERVPSDEGYYQGMLKATDGRKDERDRVQKKTFTKWVNKHLIKAQRHVTDLYEDLRDGHNLISLLEVLSGETLPRERDVVRSARLVYVRPREKGRMRFHKLQNVQIALDFLKHRQVKLVNIRNDDIADGNPKLTLGLIWTIILHFQVSTSISDIQVNGQSEDMSAKEKLLLWSQRMTDGYQGIRCDNFTTSWRDGKLFNAVIHKHYLKKRFKKKKSQGVVSDASGSKSDMDKRVVMQCEDIPSAGSSCDSGRGSQSSGARSFSEETGQEWRSQSFHGREAPNISIRPTRQYSVREVPSMESVYVQDPGQSTLGIQQLPRLIDMSKVYRQTNVENLEQAFGVAERDLGVTRLLDPEDVDVPHPDEKSIITYVSSLYDAMPRVDVHDGLRANELELRWQEYYELVTILLQWIRHHVVIFEERKFPATYEEIEILWRQFLKFKETELPVKESDKNHSKQIYQSFEAS
ncbi:hypothetical protein INR49_026652 [Caranx melampygus]|nr:hypothetical protein INR49_026652 [Caranx melampygus]